MKDLLLYGELEDGVAPREDRHVKPPTKKEEVARLERKANAIAESIEVVKGMLDRQRARLDVMNEEIAKLKETDQKGQAT